MTWTERDGTHTAQSGDYRLSVWQSAQYSTYGWTIVKGHMVKAGDAATLEAAQSEAEAAVSTLSNH